MYRYYIDKMTEWNRENRQKELELMSRNKVNQLRSSFPSSMYGKSLGKSKNDKIQQILNAFRR